MGYIEVTVTTFWWKSFFITNSKTGTWIRVDFSTKLIFSKTVTRGEMFLSDFFAATLGETIQGKPKLHAQLNRRTQ